MRFYTVTQLGPRRSLTPEGFLLCEAVPIARTGTMLYAAGEVPVEAGPDGIIRIERTPEEVFRPESMASYEGKAVTLDHPSDDVTPENWNELARGIAFNLRRGTGIEDDLLLADLLITERKAIRAAEKIREVSCGYDASYEQTSPGYGRQTDIFGNHIALVTNGRCGTRCAIGDKDTMKKQKWFDRLRATFKARDEAEFEKTLTDEPTMDDAEESEEEKKKREAEEGKKTADALTKVADALTTLTDRVAKLETRDAKAKDDGEETEEEKKKREAEEAAGKKTEDDESDEEKKKKAEDKARDSAALVTEAQEVFARAEILSPGLQMPTVDSAADPKKTRDSLCALKRKALASALAGSNRDAVVPLVGANPTFDALTCDALNLAFVGASEIVKRQNTAAQTRVTFDAGKNAAGVANSISAINRRNAEFWARQ